MNLDDLRARLIVHLPWDLQEAAKTPGSHLNGIISSVAFEIGQAEERAIVTAVKMAKADLRRRLLDMTIAILVGFAVIWWMR